MTSRHCFNSDNIFGAIDLVTSELRLFATKFRTGAVTTDAILQGIILRDGVPRVIHNDHAREFIARPMCQYAEQSL